MQTTTIGGREFAEMLRGGASKLAVHRTDVNDLNVFPIPDGDTGDNMLMTFGSGAEAAKDAGERLAEKAGAAARGMLLGARGNSGVILSRIFSGITKEFSELDSAEYTDLTRGMSAGVDEAYGAVTVPVEGTILTVFRVAVTYANGRAAEHRGDINAFFDDLLAEMGRSLERTPTLLPVLSEAGVVDSGGAGLLYIFEGMRDALLGEIDAHAADSAVVNGAGGAPDLSLFGPDSTLDYGYCTEFLLRLQSAKTDIDAFSADALAKELGALGGESIVAFREDSIVKVHVHTLRPGEILSYCQRYGEFLTLKIENMTLQHHSAAERGNNAQAILAKSGAKKKKKKTGTVAVAAGAGLRETFLSLGTDAVVDGGQSMNPSAADFLAAFREANAERIFVFPNNGNVILTARQAAELCRDAEVFVIPTHTVGEGYIALSMMDSEGTSEEIVASATETAAAVITGCVSRASRDADAGEVSVHSGDFIGFVGDGIRTDSETRNGAALALAATLPVDSCGAVLLLVGADAPDAEAKELYRALESAYPHTEFIMIDGGQPVYDYMMVLE